MSDPNDKKAKKYRKKVSGGHLALTEQLQQCIRYGITGRAGIRKVPDTTRSTCKHDLNTSELRDLLQAVYNEKANIPKYFEVRNRAFVRDVIVIHVSEYEETLSQSVCGVESELVTVRISRAQNPFHIFPQRLLTLPLMEDEPATENSAAVVGGGTMYDRYVLSQAAMRTWGYPVPSAPAAKSYDSPHVEGNDKNDDAVQSNEGVTKGVLEGYVPDLAECHRYLSFSETVRVCPPAEYIAGGKRPYSGNGLNGGVKSAKRICQGSENTSTTAGMASGEPVNGDVETGDSEAVAVELAVEEREMEEGDIYFQTTANAGVLGYHCHRCAPGHSGDDICPLKSASLELVGLDCEMCDTANGLELTRLSLVDKNGRVLLDTLVKPYLPILNYREEFSGINAALMQDVSVRLEQVQLAFLRIVTANTILVGHSLENDLKALRVCHAKCIDTAVIYPHPKGYPLRHKLKFLAKEYLHVNIQKGRGGHSSEEDARAAVQLATLKADMGPTFGVKSESDLREPLVSRLPSSVSSGFIWSNAECMGTMRSCVGGSVDTQCYANNAKAVEAALKRIRVMTSREDVVHHRSFTYLGLDSTEWDSQDNSCSSRLKDVVANIISAVQNSIANRNTLLLVSTQRSTRKVAELQKRKHVCTKSMSASVWTDELEEELQQCLYNATTASVLYTVV